VAVVAGLWGTLLISAANAADATAPGVLIIHANQRPTPAAMVIEDTLRSVVSDGVKRPVELFSEYLDTEWSSDAAFAVEQTEFLGHKYSGRNIHVIVASAPQGVQFAVALRDLKFPGVPVVHIAMPRDLWEQMGVVPGVVGKTIDLDPTATLQLALRLHPKAKRLVLIFGAAERDRVWERRARDALGRMGDGLDVEYSVARPTAEVLRLVGSLAQDAIVFTPGYFSDGTGEIVNPRLSTERIAMASSVPVYGALDTFLGTGIVGGYMTPYDEQAKQAGAMVVRLLNGATPAQIGSSSIAQVPMVDWRQVRRWRIDERSLPTDTIVKFREPTAWDKYGVEISLGVALLMLQAGLIAALLLERRSRRRTAAALEESEKQMNLAAHAAKLSTWVWDMTRDNRSAATRLGRRSNPAKEPAVSFNDVVASVHPADRGNVERAAAKALAMGEDLDVEYRVVDADGAVRWFTARGSREMIDSHRLVGIALDVTERKDAELRAAQDRNALRHMTRVSMMGQLSAAIAHQLNQPLAAILGNAETAQRMLKRERVDLEELQKICEDIVNEDHRASQVIRRLSELYTRGDMKIETIDLNGLVGETLDLLRTELLIRHVIPLTELAPDLPAIEGGYVQLQQVVLNLVINAAEAMNWVDPERRKLTLRTDSSGGSVRLHVIDTGSGIAGDDLTRVFAPFWTTKSGGMGMGLAICRSIVAAHRGTITASNNLGFGATFCVTLPSGPPS